jgi:hypothetical protein
VDVAVENQVRPALVEHLPPAGQLPGHLRAGGLGGAGNERPVPDRHGAPFRTGRELPG